MVTNNKNIRKIISKLFYGITITIILYVGVTMLILVWGIYDAGGNLSSIPDNGGIIAILKSALRSLILLTPIIGVEIFNYKGG